MAPPVNIFTTTSRITKPIISSLFCWRYAIPPLDLSPLQDQMDALLVAEPTAEANEAQLRVLATLVFTTGIVVEP